MTLAAVFVFLMGCQLLSGLKTGAKGKDFSGKWDTNWGVVELEQTGKTVDGSYTYKGVRGTITGEISNDTLYFTWIEVKGGQKAEGLGYFVLRDKGSRIVGEWGQSNEYGDWNQGEWKGRRVE